MGTFAGTPIVDYRLTFADREKQTSVFCFRSQQPNRSLHFLFAENMEVAILRLGKHRDIHLETWRNGDMTQRDIERRPRPFSLARLTFAHCANRSLFVQLLTEKQK
jgi:hypothetical protein